MELCGVFKKIVGIHNPWLCGSKRYDYGLDKRLGFIIAKTPLLKERIFNKSKKLSSSDYRNLDHKLHRLCLMALNVQLSYDALLHQKRKVTCSDLLTVHYNTSAKDYSVDELSERLEMATRANEKLRELEKTLKTNYEKEGGFLSDLF
jgi:hypothetical protein